MICVLVTTLNTTHNGSYNSPTRFGGVCMYFNCKPSLLGMSEEGATLSVSCFSEMSMKTVGTFSMLVDNKWKYSWVISHHSPQRWTCVRMLGNNSRDQKVYFIVRASTGRKCFKQITIYLRVIFRCKYFFSRRADELNRSSDLKRTWENYCWRRKPNECFFLGLGFKKWALHSLVRIRKF